MEIYQHFKGTNYVKLYEAVHTETGEILVIYHKVGDTKIIFARPHSMFHGNVSQDKYRGPRFRRIKT